MQLQAFYPVDADTALPHLLEVIVLNSKSVALLLTFTRLCRHTHQQWGLATGRLSDYALQWCQPLAAFCSARASSPGDPISPLQLIRAALGVDTNSLATIFSVNQPWVFYLGLALGKYLVGRSGLVQLHYGIVRDAVLKSNADRVLLEVLTMTPAFAIDFPGLPLVTKELQNAIINHQAMRCHRLLLEYPRPAGRGYGNYQTPNPLPNFYQQHRVELPTEEFADGECPDWSEYQSVTRVIDSEVAKIQDQYQLAVESTKLTTGNVLVITGYPQSLLETRY
jgi:hypothetical protein